MQKLLLAALFIFSTHAHANPLDDQCPTFVQTTYPVVAKEAHIEYLCHKMYAVAFDNEQKVPVYVATRVTWEQFGSIHRTNDFKIDPLTTAFDPVKSSDFVGTQYDKGHLAEAELFTGDEQAMHESFYMTNMHAQECSFNRGIWKSLETYTHGLTKQYGEIYIVSGTVYNRTSKTIGRSVTVPSHTWKVITIPATRSVEAYMFTNEDHPHEQFKKYRVSLKEIEIATGLKF